MDQNPTASGVALEGDEQQMQPVDPFAPSTPPPAGPQWQQPQGPPSLPGEQPQPGAWPHPQPESWQPLPLDPSGDLVPSSTGKATPDRRTGRLAPLFLAALLGAVLGTGATLVAADRMGFGNQGVIRVPPPLPQGSRDIALTGVAAVAEAVAPSIVQISTKTQNVFGQEGNSTGSGVIYRADGYILTNFHVVQGATDVEVVLSNGDQLEGRVIGSAAPIDDIAVIKVDRTNLPAATLGSISTTKVGELAIALGSPFGLQGTVTAGIVSAMHRSINLGETRFTEAIQTDAPINPGNSGGALVNGKGEVIGINTAIVGGSGGNVGIGFAIPIDIARRDADEIIETGRARRPLLGVLPETLPNQKGAYVKEVTPGTPAGRAGIRVGDVIVKIGDREITNGEDLILAITQLRAGQKVGVTFVRDGKTLTVQVTLIERQQ